MYLRRFARERRGKGHFIMARPIDHLDRSFDTNVRNIAAIKGFYWATALDGEERHDTEHLLGRIETLAAPAFVQILDHHDYALPPNWPLRSSTRERLAWWMSAQVLRTTRQRDRLTHLLDATQGLPQPRSVRDAAARHAHIGYLASKLSRLAFILHQRPWGLGFSDVCLATSDVPVVIINAHDNNDQLLAASMFDVLLPLDPHRFLLLPGSALQDDWRKRTDHRLKFDGGMGIVLSEIIRDAADRHLFHHPDHIPAWTLNNEYRPRLAKPWVGEDPERSPSYYLSYNVLPNEYGVERRWLTEHPPPRETTTAQAG